MKEQSDIFDLDNIPKEDLDAAYIDYEPQYKAYKSRLQGICFDLAGIIKACNFNECRVFASKIDDPDIQLEISAETDCKLYEKLSCPKAEDVEYIRANYCQMEWNFYDRGLFQLRVEIDTEEDSVHFHYDHFGLKLKHTLINILKSQSEFQSIGIAMFDNGSREIVDDSFYSEKESKDDVWIHGFEQLCDEYVVKSRYASLFKSTEEEDGTILNVLDIIIDTDSV